MFRIGPTIAGAERLLLRQLNEANARIALSSARLGSGHRLLSPADDPAAFVALSQFEGEHSAVQSALSNVTAASSVVSRTQLSLDQIRSQLEIVREKALEDVDGGLTPEQRAANQAEIDQAITAIGNLVNTDINGRRVLDGSADFVYGGLNGAQITSVQTYSLGGSTSQAISGEVNTTATQAQVTYTGAAGATTAAATITLAGDRGTASITVGNGQSLTSLRDSINSESYATGVTASVSGDTLTFRSIAYGSAADIGVTTTSGTFNVAGLGSDGQAHGTDATATINGLELTGAGNRFDVNTGSLRATVDFAAGFTGDFATVSVSGPALTFALSTDITQLSVLAIPGLQPGRLGGPSGNLSELATGGAKAGLGNNAYQAVRIVDEALAQLTRVDGVVNGFANSNIDASRELLDEFEVDLVETIESIDGVDDAEEESIIVKNQILADNALASLAILNQQRRSVLSLIQQIAGFNTSG